MQQAQTTPSYPPLPVQPTPPPPVQLHHHSSLESGNVIKPSTLKYIPPQHI